MSEIVNKTINYFQLFSADDNFYGELASKLANMLDNGVTYGFFDAGKRELMFKIFDETEIAGGSAYVVALVKEKAQFPVWFNKDGKLADIELENGSIGDISYALIHPEKMVMLTLVASAGAPSPAGFTNFMRWVADDASAGIQPVFVTDAYTQVNDWEMFRKLTLSVEAPTSDFVQEVLNTDSGEGLMLMDTLSGHRIDISVSMGNNKGSLDSARLKHFVQELLSDNYAKKLVITGKSFDGQKTDVFDLCCAKLKHKVEIKIDGNHMSANDASSAMVVSWFHNQEYIENLEPIVPEYKEDE